MFGRRRKKAGEILIGQGIRLDDPGVLQDIGLSDSDRKGHTFVFGTTRAGKTRLVEWMIEQDLIAGKNVVFFDPKGDQQIFSKIFEVAKRCDRASEMMLVTPVFPEYSVVIDPLSHYFMPDELVGHLVSGIQAGREPFYRNVAKEITMAVVMGKIFEARAEGIPLQLNIDMVREGIRRESLSALTEAMLRMDDPEARSLAGALHDILESPQDYYSKVSSTLRTCLMDLSSGNIGKIIGKAGSNKFMERLEAGRRVILIVHTGSAITREAGATLGKVILSMIHSFIGRVYLSCKQKVSPPLSIYIDEAQSLFYQGVEDLFAKVGSANVMVHAFAQSVNQLYAAVTENYAKSILDNTNTKIFMRCADAETADYVVQHFGRKKVLSSIFGSAQITTREVEEDILKAQEILRLPPRRFFMMTYSGLYRGETTTVESPSLRIEFPAAPSIQRIGGGAG